MGSVNRRAAISFRLKRKNEAPFSGAGLLAHDSQGMLAAAVETRCHQEVGEKRIALPERSDVDLATIPASGPFRR